ncbi:MAG TPA: alpha/beta fold hydrolase [Gemmatimonadaceae bacterium]|nr:alpha/beta fold hydrolase [Gemmatimonadaceae bacterium]
MLHGLEGTIRSHYIGGVMESARARGWGVVLMMHRGCGEAPNTARRFYHSGETSDLDFVFREFSRRYAGSQWLLAGVSLGGNVLLKWLGERAHDVDPAIAAAAAISVPFDLEAGARHISEGFARVYDRRFLKTLRRKALDKLRRYPDLFERDRLERAANIFEFDDAVTAPVHGFRDAVDYYRRSSSISFLDRIRVPTFLLSAVDDPFLPPQVLDRVKTAVRGNERIELEITARGGHVGFVEGPLPWKARYYAEDRAFRFFDRVLEAASRDSYDSSRHHSIPSETS